MKKIIWILLLLQIFVFGQSKSFLPLPIESSNGRPLMNKSVIIYPTGTTTGGTLLTWFSSGRYYWTGGSVTVPTGVYDVYVDGKAYQEGVSINYGESAIQAVSDSIAVERAARIAADNSEVTSRNQAISDSLTALYGSVFVGWSNLTSQVQDSIRQTQFGGELDFATLDHCIAWYHPTQVTTQGYNYVNTMDDLVGIKDAKQATESLMPYTAYNNGKKAIYSDVIDDLVIDSMMTFNTSFTFTSAFGAKDSLVDAYNYIFGNTQTFRVYAKSSGALGVNVNGTAVETDPGLIVGGKTYVVVVKYDGTNLQIRLNKALVKNATLTKTMGTRKHAIATYYNGTTGIENASQVVWTGWIHEIALFDTSITDWTIQNTIEPELYDKYVLGISGAGSLVTNGLIYRIDSSSKLQWTNRDSVYDVSGNGYHGSEIATGWGAFSPNGFWSPSKGFKFVDNFLELPDNFCDNELVGLDAMTVSFTFKPIASYDKSSISTNYWYFFSIYISSSERIIIYLDTSDGRIIAQSLTNGIPYSNKTMIGFWDKNTIYNLIITMGAGGGVNIYANGKKHYVGDPVSPASDNFPTLSFSGTQGLTGLFSGAQYPRMQSNLILYNFSLWNRALSSSEVLDQAKYDITEAQ